jgi:hypothetical protein
MQISSSIKGNNLFSKSRLLFVIILPSNFLMSVGSSIVVHSWNSELTVSKSVSNSKPLSSAQKETYLSIDTMESFSYSFFSFYPHKIFIFKTLLDEGYGWEMARSQAGLKTLTEEWRDVESRKDVQECMWKNKRRRVQARRYFGHDVGTQTEN